MREIKLKAYNKKQKILRRVIVLNLKPEYENEPSVKIQLDKDTTETWFLKDCILLPYIGLKDKNRKEIFEGDIIWYCGDAQDLHYLFGREDRKLVVEFTTEDENCGFWPFCVQNWETSSVILPKKCKVVGNIYGNPELLEEKL